MRHIVWEQSENYPVALLIKAQAFNQQEIQNNYLHPLENYGVPKNKVVAFNLEYNSVGKAPAKFIKEYLDTLLPALDSVGTKYLYVADSSYFKVLAGKPKAEPHFGYVFPCHIKGYEHMSVVLGLNHAALVYNPDLQSKLDLSLKTLTSCFDGTYQPLGQGIIHSAQYPEGLQAIQEALESLHQYPSLTCDIEAFSLRFNEAGIGTVAFAWDKHNGIAFACDYEPVVPHRELPGQNPLFGLQTPNPGVRALLRNFFETYQGELTFHHAPYDVKIFIYTLWMEDGLDTEGLLKGLHLMSARLHDTKVIVYLATNSTAGNVLGLKARAQEFAGNWAVEEIKDIRRVPLKDLLQYNLVDALSTFYVKDKYYPIMVADQQEELYKGLMLSSLKMIMQLELTGMPLKPDKVREVKAKLEAIRDENLAQIHNSNLIKVLNLVIQNDAMVAANAKLKVKQHPLEKFAGVKFNPNSGPQLQKLLYEQMGLPVIDLTDTKLPATGAETIEKLIKHTQLPAYKELLQSLINYGAVNKVLTTFIPAFETAIEKGDGIWWLHGSFNIGPVSGRLSSSDPNLQNLPAGTTGSDLKKLLGKLIKECFVAPPGWLFCGADFNSLEDYISALTTKDPQKLKVYEQGFDGHCLRAAFYYDNELTHIDVNDPKSVNSIKKTHPHLRQDSKTPTFALTYQGTYHTLMVNEGWDKEKAQRIEAKYHELYAVSDKYIADRLTQANKDGYVTVAFGLRLRTPLIAQVVWGGPRVPFEAQAEGRTAGNAMGQSYGLLNNRAAVEFFQKVWASKYKLDIKPIALIHDAIYILIKDDIEVVEWANRELIKSMQWQELPEIQHSTVKLGAALDIFWPSWAKSTTIPNNADRDTIRKLCDTTKQEVLEAAQP